MNTGVLGPALMDLDPSIGDLVLDARDSGINIGVSVLKSKVSGSNINT